MSARLCLNYIKFKIQSNQIQSNIIKTIIIVCPFVRNLLAAQLLLYTRLQRGFTVGLCPPRE